MRKIVFVHGFMSGVNSSKWKFIVDNFSDRYECVIVESDYKLETPIQVMCKIWDAIPYVNGLEEEPIVIGHSLGAFYVRAMQSFSKAAFTSILINPSMTPSKTLFKGGERSIPLYMKELYEDEESSIIQARGNYGEFVYADDGDEIVNQRAQSHMFLDSDFKLLIGGAHSFDSHLFLLNSCIKRIENMPWI